MSQVQVVATLPDWDMQVFFPSNELNQTLHEVGGFNPGKISEIYEAIHSSKFRLENIYLRDMRGFEPKEITTTDGYTWLGGLQYRSDGITGNQFKIMVLIPGFGDRESKDGVSLDRSIAIYIQNSNHLMLNSLGLVVRMLNELTTQLNGVLKLLVNDRWYVNRLLRMPVEEGKKMIVIHVPNDHPGDAPYRKHQRLIDQIIGRAPVPLGVGICSGRTSQLLLVGAWGEGEILRKNGYRVEIY